jgi:hypothetical protein
MRHVKTNRYSLSGGGVMDCLVVMVTSPFVIWFKSCIHMCIQVVSRPDGAPLVFTQPVCPTSLTSVRVHGTSKEPPERF